MNLFPCYGKMNKNNEPSPYTVTFNEIDYIRCLRVYNPADNFEFIDNGIEPKWLFREDIL